MSHARARLTLLLRHGLLAMASSLALAACSGSGRADAEGQAAQQPGPSSNPAEPGSAPAAESEHPPPPEQLVCEHIITLLALTSPSTDAERAQTQATCTATAAKTRTEDPARYLAESYCSLLSSSAEELGRCAEDPRSIPCLRAADRSAVLYYQKLRQKLEAEASANEEAHGNAAAIEHDRLLFGCLAEGFDYARLDCVLEATTHEAFTACAWD